MGKYGYYFLIVHFTIGVLLHSYVDNGAMLIVDAIMIMGSFICIEIKENNKQ